MNVLNFVVAEGEKDEKYLGTNVENIVESENVMAYGIEDELEYVVSDDYFSEENAHDAAWELEILGGGAIK